MRHGGDDDGSDDDKDEFHAPILAESPDSRWWILLILSPVITIT